jgi:hypothetical protein
MTDEEINKAIHEYRGLSPVLVEWWAYKDDDTGGSICFQAETKEQIERWLAELPETSWAKSYIPKAYYRYPKYCSDLNLMHEAEEVLTDNDWDLYCVELGYSLRGCARATARQRAEAFLRTVGKYINEPEK